MLLNVESLLYFDRCKILRKDLIFFKLFYDVVINMEYHVKYGVYLVNI